MAFKKRKIWRILNAMLWTALAGAGLFLLVAAQKMDHERRCKGLRIAIGASGNNFFVDEKDIISVIKQSLDGASPKGMPVNDFRLREMETKLEQNLWISNAELYFDNNNILSVYVREREPVARVFNTAGDSFYIDSSLRSIPVSDKFSARLPVFTGYTGGIGKLSGPDSLVLGSVRLISSNIAKDSFLMALIDQVDITPNNLFNFYPKIGRGIIVFGDTNAADTKFEKLKLFYKKVIGRAGWDYYSTIDLNYNNQVVAKVRGKEDFSADSLRTKQIMNMLAANAAKMAEDSARLNSNISEKVPADQSMTDQSVERDEEEDDSPLPPTLPAATPVVKPAIPASTAPVHTAQPAVTKPVTPKPAVTKPATTKPVANKPAAATTSPPKTIIKTTTKPATAPAPNPKPVAKPVVKPAATAPAKPAAQKPKVVMPSKPANDY